MTFDQEFGKSRASEYIQSLIDKGEIIRVPSRLEDRDIGWEFEAGNSELKGYEAFAYKGKAEVNLDETRTSTKGKYFVAHVGPAGQIEFEGKVGNAPARSFMVILKRTRGASGMAFLVD